MKPAELETLRDSCCKTLDELQLLKATPTLVASELFFATHRYCRETT